MQPTKPNVSYFIGRYHGNIAKSKSAIGCCHSNVFKSAADPWELISWSLTKCEFD